MSGDATDAGNNNKADEGNNKAAGVGNNNKTPNRAIISKEIDLIQACINRMARNSFLIKGWMISLVTVVLGIAPQSEAGIRYFLMLGATLCFWCLDAFYLRLEKLYRMKYDWVIQHREWSLVNRYNLDPENADMRLVECKAPPKAWRLMFTKSLLPLYGTVFVIILSLWIVTSGGHIKTLEWLKSFQRF